MNTLLSASTHAVTVASNLASNLASTVASNVASTFGSNLGSTADHWHDHDHDWFPWFPLVPLLFVAFWIIVITTLRRRWRHVAPRVGAESLLADRYARGEIDEAEFTERRRVLRVKR